MTLETLRHSEVLAPFFFLIGIQLRKEVTHIKEILLPSFAALGGMIFPAGIYLILNRGNEYQGGWPLVMPTDIALVMLVVLLLGKRVSTELKTFLLALAVADDLLSIIVIGGKYSGELKPTEVLASIGAVLIGAVIGKIPFEKAFTSVVNFLVLPVYVFANLWPTITGNFELNSELGNSIVISRVFGKLLGITIFALIAIKFFKLPTKLQITEIAGGGALAGMGLAVSLMIANLSFQSEQILDQVRSGLVVTAMFSAIIGSIILSLSNRKQGSNV
ncbi:MAG: Na+/H+ antiporter NhaA [Actinomycetes bacterium]